jgi:hypothetical protein|tara:strand:- start:2279 stop:3274 length:996 start_codon:yes stop_codon:yes gene_type:complete
MSKLKVDKIFGSNSTTKPNFPHSLVDGSSKLGGGSFVADTNANFPLSAESGGTSLAGDFFYDTTFNNLFMYINDSIGYENISLTDSADAAAGPGLIYVGKEQWTTTNGNTGTFTFSNLDEANGTNYTVQAGDLIVLVFGRGNTSGYYISNTPSDELGNFTFLSGAKMGGSDSYDHDHAIFYRYVTASDISTGSVSHHPDNYGTPSYQACAFHFLVFRGVTGIDNGKGTQYNNNSRYQNTNYNQTTLDAAGQFIIFSAANGWYSSSGVHTTASSNYETDPGQISNYVNDTDDINMQTWIYKSTAAETWGNPSFSSPSTTSSSDSTLVSCRVY